MAKKKISQASIKILGLKIATLRKERGLTVQALADECGVHRNVIFNLEWGEGNPRLSTLIAISKRLSVTVSELLTGI